MKLLTIYDISRDFGVTRQSVQNWIRQKKFPKGLKIGGSRRWRPEAVEEFLKEKEMGTEDLRP